MVVKLLFFWLENWTENPVCMFTFLVDNMKFLCENSVGNAGCSLSWKFEKKKSSLHDLFLS